MRAFRAPYALPCAFLLFGGVFWAATNSRWFSSGATTLSDCLTRSRFLESRVSELATGAGPTLSDIALDFYKQMSSDRLMSIAKRLRKQYAANQPFPHIAVDDLFPAELLQQVLGEFPDERALGARPQGWQLYDSGDERKLQLASEEHMGPATRFLFNFIKSSPFLHFLEELTGITDLIADPHYRGSGLHQIAPGGFLNLHADFNRYKDYKLDRRVNTFIFLNPDWDDSWGGHLELWTRDLNTCGAKILPSLGRFVVFSSTDFSYHGHPHPLAAPSGRSRRSIALYYYTNGRPLDEVLDPSYEHSTLFVDGKCEECEQCRPKGAGTAHVYSAKAITA